MEHVRIPKFQKDNKTHKRLSELSKELHKLKLKGEGKETSKLEMEVDKTICKLFGLT